MTPSRLALNPLILTKFVVWIIVTVVATVLLTRHRMSRRTRTAFVIGGMILFGFIYGALLAPGLNPNPVASVRTLLKGLLVQKQSRTNPSAAMPASWVCSRTYCTASLRPNGSPRSG